MTPIATIPLSSLQALAPVGLDELMERAELQTRIDRKYLLPAVNAARVGDTVPEDTRVLQIDGLRAFRYATTYFDTPGLVSFLGAAYKRQRRYKVRTRVYEDSGLCFLEVKTRRGRQTVKDRLPYDAADRHRLTPEGAEFVARVLEAARLPGVDISAKRPVLDTHFVRSTLLLNEPASRVTIDRGLVWSLIGEGHAHQIEMPDRAVVETKTGSSPSSADRTLWSNGDRPVSFSKYATGFAGLRPELPRNRWDRLLRQRFEPARVIRSAELSA
jgi:hypothetical protein